MRCGDEVERVRYKDVDESGHDTKVHAWMLELRLQKGSRRRKTPASSGWLPVTAPFDEKAQYERHTPRCLFVSFRLLSTSAPYARPARAGP